MASDQKRSSITDSSTAQAAKGRRRGSLFEVGFPARCDRGSSIVSIPSMIPSHIAHHQKVRYENTYKMEPDKRFNIHEVKEVLQETLDESLQEVKKYDSARCRALANTLSHTITERVKLLGFKRFKFVATVTIGEMKGQGIRSASRFLWNEKHDNWVDAVFTSPEIFAVAVVYAIYQE